MTANQDLFDVTLISRHYETKDNEKPLLWSFKSGMLLLLEPLIILLEVNLPAIK